MKSHKLTAVLLITAFALAFIPAPARAQRLYNKERDQQAQAALPLAQALKTGELFDRQLRNLAAITKRDFDTQFALTKSQIGEFSLDVLTWGSAHDKVCQIVRRTSGTIPSAQEIATELKTVKDSITEAQKSLDAFKKSVKAIDGREDGEDKEEKPVLATIFGSLGEFEEITGFVEDLGQSRLVNPQTIQTLKEVQKIAGELKKVYDAYTAKVDEFNKLDAQLADLRIVLKKVAIQSLQVDEEHWKNLAAITARREAETADVLSLISQYKGVVGRLQLVEFDEEAEKPVLFCKAVSDARAENANPDFNLHQIITDHMHEVTLRGQAIDNDSREIETEALNALAPMSGAASEAQRRAAAEKTLTALCNAIRNIHDNESTHLTELNIRQGMVAVESNLQNAIRKSKDLSLAALRAVIVRARSNRSETRGMVSDIPQALYILAALIARGTTPQTLAELRFAQELHAYSIRKSAVRARAYELTVSTGAQRLALFHKGGIKPTEIAQLVFAASNTALLAR